MEFRITNSPVGFLGRKAVLKSHTEIISGDGESARWEFNFRVDYYALENGELTGNKIDSGGIKSYNKTITLDESIYMSELKEVVNATDYLALSPEEMQSYEPIIYRAIQTQGSPVGIYDFIRDVSLKLDDKYQIFN